MGDEVELDAAARLLVVERELREALERERRLRALFDHTFQLMGLLALDGTLVEANQSSLTQAGVERADVLGRHFADTPWWAHSEVLRARLRQAIETARGGALDRFEATHLGTDGSERTVDFSIKPLLEGGVVSGLVCEGRDITDRKRAEVEATRSRAMLAMVFDAIPVRVFWKDRDCRYLGCNLAFARDAGVGSVAEVIGKNDFDFGWRPQAELYRRDDLRVMESGAPVLGYEEPQTSPDGGDLWLRTSKLPLRDPDGTVFGVLGLYEDITQRKHEERQRIALEGRVQSAQKLESLGLLAGGIAHDFNNLATTIAGNVDLLLVGEGSAEERASALDGIATASRRARELCRRLLSYAGRGEPEVGPIDVNELVVEMTKLLRVTLRQGAVLTVEIADGLPAVTADATQLRQVIMNLVTNAADALRDGPGEIRLRTLRATSPLTGGESADGVELVVEDTGCGIPESTRARIFEPFFSTKGPGRGLGLATVLGIVRAHGGTLAVDGAAGRGTRVSVFVPLASPVRDSLGMGWKGRGRVLVVDDEPEALAAEVAVVRQLGLEVDTASGGREALDRYEMGTHGVVIVDLMMPRVDGIETTRALRARDPNVKVVLVSGYDVGDVLERLDQSRPDAFLEKPFTRATLAEVLQRVLQVDGAERGV